MVSTLATTDALAKLLIAKGIITDEEIKIQLAKNGRIMWCAEAGFVSSLTLIFAMLRCN